MQTTLNAQTVPPAPAIGVYSASTIKRRRTKAAVNSIRGAIREILKTDHPQTVRQVFYALTVRGAVKKIENEYQQTVIRLLVDMREAGEIPFNWIADNTRWMRKPATYVGLDACLKNTANFYRRDLWAAMPVYVEVWCEKDALAGVLIEETEPYDVPLMVARGYSSISFLHSAAKAIEAKGKPAHIYHFGDLDPSGVDAARDIEAKLHRYSPNAEIHFERPAVTREQVEQWNLPSRPTKIKDPRAKKFAGTSVELDAIPASKLRELVRGALNGTSTKSSSPFCAQRRNPSARRSASGQRSSRGARQHDRARRRSRLCRTRLACLSFEAKDQRTGHAPRLLRRDDEPGHVTAMVCQRVCLQHCNSHRDAEQYFRSRHRWCCRLRQPGRT